MPLHPKVVTYSSFKGINSVGNPENVDPSYLMKALNIDIDKTGNLSKRKGYSKVDTANYTSLWASENGLGCYAVRNGDLVEVLPNYLHVTLKSSIGNIRLSFEEVDGTIYLSSPILNGTIVNHTFKNWGIEKNHLSPTLSIGAGTLPAGDYQVSFTYVNTSGIESGTGPASLINVPNNSSILVTIPNITDPEILYARVYSSTPNGNSLYFNNIGLSGSTVTISSISNLIDPLRTFNIDKAPLGHIVKYYRGRMYIAQDNILWYSEPFQYTNFKLASNYFEFPERIREVMPVEDGIWLGSDKLYYLSGEEPEKFKRTTKERIKVVEGTSTLFSGSYIHLDNTPVGYKWLVTSDLGIFVLFNQGLVINLTSQTISLKKANQGTSIFLQENGNNQYLSILKINENPNNSVMGDLVETSIIRNGLIIT
jgi:hypothetical protein